jgi:hypothetical protein
VHGIGSRHPALPGSAVAQTYHVDAQVSDIHWLVYTAGVFAHFGHNHVISVSEVSGTVTRRISTEGSTFELSIPVSSLVVDEPSLRAHHGEDFRSEPSAKDISGTRRHMLGDRVLDVAHYPTIRVHGEVRAGEIDSDLLSITVQMLGRNIRLSVPARVEIEGNALIASGEFSVTHAELGMEPYRAVLGMLAVSPRIDFFYRVRAIKAE